MTRASIGGGPAGQHDLTGTSASSALHGREMPPVGLKGLQFLLAISLVRSLNCNDNGGGRYDREGCGTRREGGAEASRGCGGKCG